MRGGSQGKAGFPERPGSKPGAAPAHQRVPSDDKARAAASWPAWGAARPGGALGTGCWAGRALDSSPSAFPDKARMAVIPRSWHNPASWHGQGRLHAPRVGAQPLRFAVEAAGSGVPSSQNSMVLSEVSCPSR